MATGFVQRFKGRIMAESLWLGRSGMFDSATGIRGMSDFVLKISLPVTAVANIDFSISLPPGGALIGAQVFTTTQYGAVTNANFTLGSTVGGNDFVTAVDIKTVGLRSLTLVTGTAAILGNLPTTLPNVFARIAQVGGNSATGAGFLLLNYTAQ